MTKNYRTNISISVNYYGQSVCGLRTEQLRTDSRAAANRKLSKILKKGGLVVNQTVVLLINICGNMKCVPLTSPFLKLRQALVRCASCLGGSANTNLNNF